MLVLVRLLPPSSYGEFTLTTSIISFLTWVSFSNFISYTIQVKSDEDVHYQEHFTAGGILQLGVFILANIIGFLLSVFPAYASVAPYVHVMSITLLLGWPTELRRVMLARQFAWGRIVILNAIGIVTGAIAGPLLAFAGAGTYALLLPGLLVHIPFIYDLFINEKWRPTWAWSWAAYRPAYHFGLTRISSGAAVGGRSMIESSVLAATLGLAGLGIYTRSIGLAQMFCSKFASELLNAIYPLLTRVGENAESTVRIGGLVFRVVAWVTIPIAVTLGTMAPQVVYVVYGRQWDAVIPLLPWAMLLAILGSMSGAGSSLLLSRQQPKLSLAIDLILLAGTAGALFVSISNGSTAYLQALVIIHGLLLGVVLYWACKFNILNSKGIQNAILPPVLSAGIAWALVSWLHPLPVPETQVIVQTIMTSLIWGAMFTVFYLICLRLFFSGPLSGLIIHFPAQTIIKRIFLMT
jgi:O-antigen/teichoic acid export membrane protein